MRNPMIHHIQKALNDNLPQILSGAAVAGVIGTAVLAVKATPKAMSEIQLEEIKRADESPSEIIILSPADKVSVTWRCYIPAVLCGTATIACIIGSNAIGLRRNAALLAAYTLVDTTFREYKDKVIEQVTSQKAQKIDDEVMEDRIKKNPPKPETIIVTGGGDQLCYESLTGRYFKSSAEKIRRAALDYDARILQGDAFASLNEWFQDLELDPTDLGNLMGFNIECRLKVVLSTHLTECDQPALAIQYEKLPIYNYDKW